MKKSFSFLLIFLFQIFQISLSFDFGENFENSFFEINIDRDHPDDIYKEFEDFIVKYKKSYKDEIEKKFRFQLFTATHNKIGKMNERSGKMGQDTKFGHNKFSDRTKQEMDRLFFKMGPKNDTNMIPMYDPSKHRVKRQTIDLPKKFDLRTIKLGGRYIVGDAKDQGACSSCWAFAATALAEIAYSVHLKKMVTLSDQEICDCAAQHGPACKGGLPNDGLEYIKQFGVTLESEYPYSVERSNETGHCDADKYERELNSLTLDYYSIDPFNAEYQITHHLVALKTPVSVAFRIGDDFNFYKSDVLQFPGCDHAKETHYHSGVIIGFGTTVNSLGKKVDYWIFRNSWSGDWGEAGHARIIRGEDWCGIESLGTGARVPE
ncbi:hypothetical protein L5515_008695 [Caenorhabditis briggsae]|uniref:Uncharacterized protein n=1 Tax=Caenorhabditis briggsae TaxID=6238 RepID=A0AAE9A5V8_CAEBR|nr:hypothetical protein L3Y34_008857 [Caenorhabditis briggsae]UMM36607.1 hypothetical protein L5515_008695 [Caenorhabditis briggsae]